MKTFNYTTHSKQVLGDMHTPVSIYLKVRDMYPQSALMESSDYHAGENSLSFIALCPLANIGVNSGIVTANYPDNSRTEEPLTKTFTVEKAMNRFINQFQVTGENKNVCGLYGYTTFNAVKYFEHIPVKESIILLIMTFFHRDMFEVFHCVECGVSVKSAHILVFSGHLKLTDELIHRFFYRE